MHRIQMTFVLATVAMVFGLCGCSGESGSLSGSADEEAGTVAILLQIIGRESGRIGSRFPITKNNMMKKLRL